MSLSVFWRTYNTEAEVMDLKWVVVYIKNLMSNCNYTLKIQKCIKYLKIQMGFELFI